MSTKEIRATLKEVKEAIKLKDNGKVISKCEGILKQDPENYMALIFLGAAYQESNKKEAAKFLRKAITYTNEPAVALQGLANCAEIDELPNIYKQLLQLVPNKYADYHTKILHLSTNNSVWEQCVDILQSEIKICNNQEDDRVKSARLKITSILCMQKNLPEKYNELFKSSLEYILLDSDNENYVDYYKRYLKHLYRLNIQDVLFEKAKFMSDKYPDEIYPLEWICKLYTENFDGEHHNIVNNSIDVYIERILNIDKNSSLGKFAKAIKLYLNGQYVACRDLLLQVNEKQLDRVLRLKLLYECYLKLCAYNLAEDILRELNTNKVDLIKCLVHVEENNGLEEAVELCTELLLSSNTEEKTIILDCLIRAHVRLEQTNKAKEDLELIHELKDDLLVKYNQAEYFESPHNAINILNGIGRSTFRKNFLLGIKYYEIEQYDKSIISLAHATKEQPYNSNCFFWLGKVYIANNDWNSAQKCFEKCVNLNPRNEKAICHLISLYKRNEEWDASYQILEKSLKYFQGPKSKWVQFRLGQHHLNSRNSDEAINAFRSAVRLDVNDIMSWEGLADAYQQRGSYNSALKVYQKILELDENNAYAKLQIAIIKTTLKMFGEAIECFDELLTQYPEYLPGLKGAAECHYALAIKLLRQRLIGRCKDHLQKATDLLQKGISVMNRNFVCVWRLLANVFAMAASLPKSKASLKVLGKLAGQEEDIVILEGPELFELAARFYICAIKINEDDPFLWHELSLCYYNYAKTYGADNSKTMERLKLARDACKKTIKLQPTRWQNWNLLGVICASKVLNNLPLAQHCFIKALQLDRKSAVAWTNLGVLYLAENQIQLANKAFGRAQRSETSFVNAWIGQAIIAEQMGHAEEAMDLFRHCTQLDFHVESAIGYAYWVCSVLSNPDNLKDPNYKYAIENMYAVPLALDSMNWYYESEGNNSSIEPISYLGFLNTKQNLYDGAIKSFKFAAERASQDAKDKMFCNLGYSYLRSNQSYKAIDAFKLINTATVQSTIGLALAQYKAKQYEESYSAYNSALEWLASNDEEKSVILLAMSAVAYAAQGEDDAKSLLLQCIHFSKPPVQALFSTCAFSILHNEPQITEATLEELKEYENNIDYAHHVAFLTSQVYLANGETKKGLFYLISRVHAFPDRPLVRKVFVNYVLQNCSKFGKLMLAASRIAESIIALDLRNPKRSNNPSLDAAKSLALASNAMKYIDENLCKKLAQRAVHLNPQCKEAWSALIPCI